MKNFFYTILVLAILIVLFDLLPSGKGYWAGNYPDCYSIDQCECGASGYMHTKSLGFIEIPYSLESCSSTHERVAKEREEINYLKKKQEKESEERLQELFEANSCDTGWIFVNDHCERCDSSETFKVSESDCLKCNQYEELRVYDSQSSKCKLKK